jgi:hypothetical protein
MNEEDIQNSLELLRARRQSLGDLRDYKPQRSGAKKSSTPKAPEKDVEDTFSDLIQASDATE